MAPDSELYDWRDRSDIKKMLPANASSLRWCSENKKGMQNIHIYFQKVSAVLTLFNYLKKISL